jgi:hypothetical protein
VPEKPLASFFTRFERCDNVIAASEDITINAQVCYLLSGLQSLEAFVRDLNMQQLIKSINLAFLRNYLLQYGKDVKDTTTLKSMQNTPHHAAFARMEQGASAQTSSLRDRRPTFEMHAPEKRGSCVKGDTLCRSWADNETCPFGLTCKFRDVDGRKYGGNISVPTRPDYCWRVCGEPGHWWVDCKKSRFPPRSAREVTAVAAADYEDEYATMAFSHLSAYDTDGDGMSCSECFSPGGKTLTESGSY